MEVLKNGKLELAIIVSTPPPPDYIERLMGYSKDYFDDGFDLTLDISDYIYNTITYEKGINPENIIEKRSQHFYDHTSFLDIFPASTSFSIEQKHTLEGLYEFCHQPVEG